MDQVILGKSNGLEQVSQVLRINGSRREQEPKTEEIYTLGGIWSKEVESTGKNRIVKITGEYIWS